jgi:hypothetical protein
MLVISREDRVAWQTDGISAFANFFKAVCNIPHIRELADTNHNLCLLPHNSNVVLEKFKRTLEKMVWLNLGNTTHKIFVDTNGNAIEEFGRSNLVSLTALAETELDQNFEVQFSSGVNINARVNEEGLISLFYNNSCVFESLGTEMCIALDVALASGGCEAVS